MSASSLHSNPFPRKPSDSQPVTFFSLPIEIRNNIYERLLRMPNECRMFHDPGCGLELFLPDLERSKWRAWNSLVYTNRQMSSEARAVLYRVNYFILPETSFARRYRGSIVQSFLSSIGPTNAGFLSHLCITFPELETLDGSEEIKVPGYALQDLHRLQIECIELRTLEVSIHDDEIYELLEEERISNQNVRHFFVQITQQIKAINSINKMVLRVHNGSVNSPARDFMQGLGWTVLSTRR